MKVLVFDGFITSQLISMLFLHVPTPFRFLGMTSGAVQENRCNFKIIRFKGMVQHFGKYAHSLSCQELDETINTTLMYIS